MLKTKFKITNNIILFLTFSVFLGVNNAQAVLVFKGQEGYKSPEIKAVFESLGRDTHDPVDVAEAFFKRGEMMVEGYCGDPFRDGQYALSYYQRAYNLLNTLRGDEVPVNQEAHQKVVDLQLKVAARLTDFYLMQDEYAGIIGIHACETYDRSAAVDLYRSIVSNQFVLRTQEQRAEALYQFAITLGREFLGRESNQYYKCLEEAAVRGHIPAIKTLAGHCEDKAATLRSLIKPDNTHVDAEVFSLFAWMQPESGYTRLYKSNRQEFLTPPTTIYLSEAESDQLKARMSAITENSDDLPASLIADIEESRKKKFRAFRSLNVCELATMYEEENLALLREAAYLGDTIVCRREGMRYSGSVSVDLGIRPDDRLAFYFFYQGAKHKNALCYFKLGEAFRLGRGTTENKETAIDCYLMTHQLENSYNGKALEEMGILDWRERKPQGLVKFDKATEDELFDGEATSHRLFRSRKWDRDADAVL